MLIFLEIQRFGIEGQANHQQPGKESQQSAILHNALLIQCLTMQSFIQTLSFYERSLGAGSLVFVHIINRCVEKQCI